MPANSAPTGGGLDTVTATVLARHFGVTPRAIGDLVKRKVIEPVQSSELKDRPRFDLEASTRRAMATCP
jgi:hypothetical protein